VSSDATQILAPAGAPFIEVTREFDAPPELVFRASTDPDLVVQWLGPRDVQMRIIEFDARTGSSSRGSPAPSASRPEPSRRPGDGP
jgi:uncharacterized protein YndB with AHSA1/START domain